MEDDYKQYVDAARRTRYSVECLADQTELLVNVIQRQQIEIDCLKRTLEAYKQDNTRGIKK